MLYITTEWVHWKNAFSLQFRQARCTCVVHVAQLMSSSALSCSVSCWGALRCCVLFAETDGVKEQLWAKGTLQSCTGLASHTCLWGEQAQRWYCSIIYPFVLSPKRASSNVVWVLLKSYLNLKLVQCSASTDISCEKPLVIKKTPEIGTNNLLMSFYFTFCLLKSNWPAWFCFKLLFIEI